MGFQNMDRLMSKLNKLKSNAEPVVIDALESAANTVRNAAVKSIAGAASGQPYTRYRPKRNGVASKAGDPPHTDTGNLNNNIQVKRYQRSVDVGLLGNKAEYGKYLEFGTRTMAARPWLRPAFTNSKAVIQAKLKATGKEITVTVVKG